MSAVQRNLLPPTALQPRGISEILVALARIEPHQLVVYHRGRLANDRRKRYDPVSREIDALAHHVIHLAKRERVHLIQFRDESDGYVYVAAGASDNKRLS